MGLASYEITGGAGEWRVSHDGKAENVYQTKESAFEAAVAAASLALRQGHEVIVRLPATALLQARQTLGKQFDSVSVDDARSCIPIQAES
jgi:hypothetical protein